MAAELVHLVRRADTDNGMLRQLAAGGFIVVGVLCAVWRGAVNLVKKRVNMEAKKYQ